jgi:hypothetical protein
VSNSWKIGGVQLELREDGHFSIYQPDSNRVMPQEIAVEVACTILGAANGEADDYPDVSGGGVPYPPQSTVGGGVIATSEGPQLTDSEAVASSDSSDAQRSDGLMATELEADRNALEASAKLDVRDLLGQMTSEAHADGTDETVTDFGPARTEKPKPPARRKPGRPRRTT